MYTFRAHNEERSKKIRSDIYLKGLLLRDIVYRLVKEISMTAKNRHFYKFLF